MAESYKLDIYDFKREITIAGFPNMEKDDQQELLSNLKLPDDMLDDIIGDERPDNIETIEKVING